MSLKSQSKTAATWLWICTIQYLQPGESANLCSADWSGLCTDTEPEIKRPDLTERHAREMLPSVVASAHITDSVGLQTNITDTDRTTETRSRHSLTLQAPLNFTSATPNKEGRGKKCLVVVVMGFRILISRLIYINSLIPFILVNFIFLNTLLCDQVPCNYQIPISFFLGRC